MYSVLNEGKSVVTEKLIRTLKNKIYQYMTSKSKNVYIDKLDDLINKYNNAYYKKIKKKTGDVKPSTYIDCSKKINDKDPTFEIVECQDIKTFLQKVCLKLI